MSILKRLRERLANTRAALRPAAGVDPERMAFSAEIPGAAGAPLWKLNIQLVTEPHGNGEKLRLRAHVQTNLASALRPALSKPSQGERPAIGSDSHRLTRSERAGQLAQRVANRALQLPLLRVLAEPLLHLDFNTWIELQASTASLDKGAQDLLPAQEQLARLGIRPKGGDGPIAESWAGEAPGGFAQVSLLQMDKRHLPPQLAQMLGAKPFQLAAAIVNVVEEK
jgi:hypothetical protein